MTEFTYFIHSDKVHDDKFWAIDKATNMFNDTEEHRKGWTIYDRRVIGATINDGRKGFVVTIEAERV